MPTDEQPPAAVPLSDEPVVKPMTPDEFQAEVKSLCDPLARFAPRDVMHFTCLRLVKTVNALAASAEKTRKELDAARAERDAEKWRREAAESFIEARNARQDAENTQGYGSPAHVEASKGLHAAFLAWQQAKAATTTAGGRGK